MKDFELKDFEEDIMRYSDGLSVSKEFLKALEHNVSLQASVLTIKSDMYFIKNIEDSPMFNFIEKKSGIVVRNNIIDYITAFVKITPLLARGEGEVSVYSFKNIEFIIERGIYTLNINKIKKWCVIEKNGKKIVNIFSKKENYSIEIERGDYLVKVDDIESRIKIE